MTSLSQPLGTGIPFVPGRPAPTVIGTLRAFVEFANWIVWCGVELCCVAARGIPLVVFRWSAAQSSTAAVPFRSVPSHHWFIHWFDPVFHDVFDVLCVEPLMSVTIVQFGLDLPISVCTLLNHKSTRTVDKRTKIPCPVYTIILSTKTDHSDIDTVNDTALKWTFVLTWMNRRPATPGTTSTSNYSSPSLPYCPIAVVPTTRLACRASRVIRTRRRLRLVIRNPLIESNRSTVVRGIR